MHIIQAIGTVANRLRRRATPPSKVDRWAGVEPLESRLLLSSGDIISAAQNGSGDIRFTLEILDVNGTTMVDQIGLGDDFLLNAFVEDIRDLKDPPENAEGPYIAFLDIILDANLVTFVPAETQQLVLPDDTNGGTFTLEFDGSTTAAISFNPDPIILASTIDTALENLPNIGPDNTTVMVIPVVEGPVFNPNGFGITFRNNLANMDHPEIIADGTGLTLDNGGSTNIAVTELATSDVNDPKAFFHAFQAGPDFLGLSTANNGETDPDTNQLNPNVLDEVGVVANDNSFPPGTGGDARLMWTLRMRGTAAGTATFTLDAAESLNVLLEGVGGSQVPNDQIVLGNSLNLDILPRPSAETDSFQIDEDNTGTDLDVIDNDLPPGPHGANTLTITHLNGSPVSNGQSQITSNGGTITFTGNGFNYVPSPEFFGNDTFTYTIESAPYAGIGPDDATVNIDVQPINDAPVNSIPGPLSVDEDTTLSFIGPNAISIEDIDAGSNDVSVTLTSVGGLGVLNVPTTSGVSITNNNSSNVELLGTVNDLNNALSGLTYQPSANTTGSDTLQVTTDDLGNTGGSVSPATDTVNITIQPVNDAPTLVIPGSQLFFTDFDNQLSSSTNNVLQVTDIDAGDDVVEVDLTVSDGTLTITDVSGLSSISGNGTNVVSIQGSISNINDTFSDPGLVFNSTNPVLTTLSVTVDDMGHNGGGTVPPTMASVDLNVVRVSNVTVVQRGKTAVVTGDENSNQIVFSSLGSLNSLQITGLQGTNVNGQNQVTFDNVQQLKVNLQDGDDVLQLGNGLSLNLPGNLDITMVDGSDQILGNGGTIQGRVSIKSADSGGDLIDLRNMQLGKDLKITNTGPGGNQILLDGLLIDGDFNFTARSGNNYVEIRGGTNIVDDVKIKMGADDDDVLLEGVLVGDDLSIDSRDGQNTTTVGGGTSIGDDVKISTGRNDDSVILDGILIGDDAHLKTSTGDDVIIANGDIGDSLKIDSQLGNDQVILDDLQINDDLIINDRGGNNTLNLTESQVDDDVRIKTGKEDDNLLLSELFIGDELSVSTSNGPGALDVIDVTVQGSLKVRMGNDTDEFMLDQVNVFGQRGMNLNLGGGDDLLDILDGSIQSKVRLDLGKGDDSATIRNSFFDSKFDAKAGVGNDLLTSLNSHYSDTPPVFNMGSGNDTLNVGATQDVNIFDNVFPSLPKILGAEDLDTLTLP